MSQTATTGDSLTKIGTIMLEAVNPELRKMAEYVERTANAAMEHEATIKKETPSLLKSAAGAMIGGPAGAIGAEILFPRATVSQAQEDAAMEQWRMEHGGGDDKEAYLRQLERNHGLPPGSMSQIWAQESGKGKNKGPSSKGAMGYFQLMPKTWEGYKRPEDDNVNDFYQNSAAAARLLDELYNKQFKGDWDATLRWYNAGKLYNIPQAHRYADEVMAQPIGGGGSSASKTDIQVNGPITINTQATDAQGIKQDLASSVSQHSQMAGMADTGTH